MRAPTKIVIDLTDGLVNEVISSENIEVIVLDYDDEDPHHSTVKKIDGKKAHVYTGIEVIINPEKVEKIKKRVRRKVFSKPCNCGKT